MIDGGRRDKIEDSKIFEELKKKSVFLEQPITYAPHTIAAMHAVFSGTYGNKTGTNSYWSTYKFKKNKFKTITEYLHELNYYTYSDVVNKLVIPKQGFDKFMIHDENKDDLTIRHIDLLEQMKKENEKGKEFFLYVQYSSIHTGIMNEVLKVYNNFSKEYFDNKKLNENRYNNLFSNAESYLEKMLDKIQELTLDKNSIILIMSDHGISVGEKIGERAYGAFCYDYTIRTFAYLIAPNLPITNVKQQVRTIDFLPTLLNYLDIENDPNYEEIDGESLLPIIKGDKITEKYAFSETGNPLKGKEPPKEPNVKSIRTSKWKLIYNTYDNTKEVYNIESDPNEENNLSEENLEIQEILWKEIQKYL
jgi:arylsulfatase A-like enzyme